MSKSDNIYGQELASLFEVHQKIESMQEFKIKLFE